jgi:hypothetical protein
VSNDSGIGIRREYQKFSLLIRSYVSDVAAFVAQFLPSSLVHVLVITPDK